MVFGRKKEAAAPPPPPPPAQPSPAQRSREMTRQTDRAVAHAQRDMQRERLKLEAEEKKIMTQIKTLGRQGRMAEAKMLAKNLVQVRNAKQRTFQASLQAGAIGTQAKMAQTDAKLMNIMGNTVGIMQNANSLANPDQQMKMLQEFDMQSEKYKLNQEMTDEVLDSVLGGEEVDQETDDVLNSVLDEIGLQVGAKMGAAPAIQPQQVAQQPQGVQTTDDMELMNRIAKLGGVVCFMTKEDVGETTIKGEDVYVDSHTVVMA